MISVVIPTLNAERTLAATLTALVPAAVDGLVRDVIIVDGGSRDATGRIADQAGATFITAEPGRGGQLSCGAKAARGQWLLFLHADSVLEPRWDEEAQVLMRRVDTGEMPASAGAFRFRLDDRGLSPRLLEGLVRLRCAVFGLPYGDQGLLISRALFDEIGGYRDLPIMEDVDIIRRVGRRRLVQFQSAAVTSAERYKKDGYIRRSLRNQMCLALYSVGVPAQRIQQIYGRAKS